MTSPGGQEARPARNGAGHAAAPADGDTAHKQPAGLAQEDARETVRRLRAVISAVERGELVAGTTFVTFLAGAAEAVERLFSGTERSGH